jgi:hypothetical protein
MRPEPPATKARFVEVPLQRSQRRVLAVTGVDHRVVREAIKQFRLEVFDEISESLRRARPADFARQQGVSAPQVRRCGAVVVQQSDRSWCVTTEVDGLQLAVAHGDDAAVLDRLSVGVGMATASAG